MLYELAEILPAPPTGTPTELAQDGITFFSTWISRIGGLIAFIGAIKFALSIRSDDGKEQMTALLVMVSGFMIQAAVSDLGVFDIPKTYSAAAAEKEFKALLAFIQKWVRRVGGVGSFIGAFLFALSIKDNNPGAKVMALKTFAAGAIAVSVAAVLNSFV